MAYGPNTSRTNRLPHGFFDETYALIFDAEDILNAADHENPPELEDVLGVLRAMTAALRRQRQSHLGMESL